MLWFAVLQTVTPFIHAHLESDAPDQQYGLHMHDQDVLATAFGQQSAVDRISAPPVHTIGVNKAVVQHFDLLPLPLFCLLFVISLSLIVSCLSRFASTRQPIPLLHLRSLARPRAPPLF